jgi:hypothetical protein
MRVWTLAGPAGDRCNYDGVPIAPGEPMQVITVSGVTRKQLRCRTHAQGDVNWQEIENERWRLEQERLAASKRAQSVASSPVVRFVRSRHLTPLRDFASSIFDSKAAAAGDRHDE